MKAKIAEAVDDVIMVFYIVFVAIPATVAIMIHAKFGSRRR